MTRGRAQTSVLVGLEPIPISVEACCNRGPAFFQMVGLPEAAVREARVRVASALATLGVLLDEYAVTVNLAPADVRKTGASLDLPLALAVLAAINNLPAGALDGILFLGELALDGSVRPIRGVLAHLDRAAVSGFSRCVIPDANRREGGLVENIDVRVAGSLGQVVDFLSKRGSLERAPAALFRPEDRTSFYGDLSEVRGQATARRGLELTAAGGHNLLMIGPPGSGKTLLARLLPTIMPPLTFEEALETTKVYSVAGLLDPQEGIVRRRPFRDPHHSVTEAGLIGGGEMPRPGEVSLAHHGVLFLDELSEFRRPALEALRLPLEDGQVCIGRARARAWFPSGPIVVGATNPCPCGYLGHPRRPCRCTPRERRAYLRRLPRDIDRLDLHLSVSAVDPRALTTKTKGESSRDVYERVRAARERQYARCRKEGLPPTVNARLSLAALEHVSAVDARGRHTLEQAMNELGLSARAYVKVLRVARTIADLEKEETVRHPHVCEAIQGRFLDHKREGKRDLK